MYLTNVLSFLFPIGVLFDEDLYPIIKNIAITDMINIIYIIL